MQDADRPAEVQALPRPGRARRARVESQPLRGVPPPEGLDRIVRHCGRSRNLGQEPAVRSPEPERAVGLTIDLVALLVDRAVVAATEEREVGERGRTAFDPVAHVMALAEREPAAREPAALVPVRGTPSCRHSPRAVITHQEILPR